MSQHRYFVKNDMYLEHLSVINTDSSIEKLRLELLAATQIFLSGGLKGYNMNT